MILYYMAVVLVIYLVIYSSHPSTFFLHLELYCKHLNTLTHTLEHQMNLIHSLIRIELYILSTHHWSHYLYLYEIFVRNLTVTRTFNLNSHTQNVQLMNVLMKVLVLPILHHHIITGIAYNKLKRRYNDERDTQHVLQRTSL